MKGLFDIAHKDPLKLIKNEEDKKFLLAQREKRRRGSMTTVKARKEAAVSKKIERIERQRKRSKAEEVIASRAEL